MLPNSLSSNPASAGVSPPYSAGRSAGRALLEDAAAGSAAGFPVLAFVVALPCPFAFVANAAAVASTAVAGAAGSATGFPVLALSLTATAAALASAAAVSLRDHFAKAGFFNTPPGGGIPEGCMSDVAAGSAAGFPVLALEESARGLATAISLGLATQARDLSCLLYTSDAADE